MAMEKTMIRNIAVVSLSRGMIGEPDVQFEVEIGIRRLEEYGLHVKFMPHALKGLEYVKAHPEKRAEDLLQAFRDPEIDMILCAIGGDDTYRLLPYLFDHDELKNAVTNKVFLGFSDTTVNHLMLHKAGLRSFYGQAFLPDICEPGPEMLPYTRKYFEELIRTGHIREITPSPVWYAQRESFTPDQTGKQLPALPDHGFELLQGPPVFSGKILGGCIDTIYDCFNDGRYADMPALCKRYHLFPSAADWSGRILLLETSGEKPAPEKSARSAACWPENPWMKPMRRNINSCSSRSLDSRICLFCITLMSATPCRDVLFPSASMRSWMRKSKAFVLRTEAREQ